MHALDACGDVHSWGRVHTIAATAVLVQDKNRAAPYCPMPDRQPEKWGADATNERTHSNENESPRHTHTSTWEECSFFTLGWCVACVWTVPSERLGRGIESLSSSPFHDRRQADRVSDVWWTCTNLNADVDLPLDTHSQNLGAMMRGCRAAGQG